MHTENFGQEEPKCPECGSRYTCQEIDGDGTEYSLCLECKTAFP